MSVSDENNYPSMSNLAETFPTLHGKPGVRPFEPSKLVRQYGVASGGEKHAIAFVLTVFNGAAMRAGSYKPVRPFDAEEAASTWDPTHRRAFTTWFAAPWWP